MKILLIIILSLLLLPISLPFWFAWSFAEAMREPNDNTIWNKNPFTFW